MDTITARATDRNGTVITGGSTVTDGHYLHNVAAVEVDNYGESWANVLMITEYYCGLDHNGEPDYGMVDWEDVTEPDEDGVAHFQFSDLEILPDATTATDMTGNPVAPGDLVFLFQPDDPERPCVHVVDHMLTNPDSDRPDHALITSRTILDIAVTSNRVVVIPGTAVTPVNWGTLKTGDVTIGCERDTLDNTVHPIIGVVDSVADRTALCTILWCGAECQLPGMSYAQSADDKLDRQTILLNR